MSRILSRKNVYTVPWFKLRQKHVRGEKKPFYSLAMRDYVTVLAIREDGRVLLIHQYRPAVERLTPELPSGTVDKGETPERAARRELEEETGYRAGKLEFMGCVWNDTGRLENRLWCYFAGGVRASGNRPEAGIHVRAVSPKTFIARIKRGGGYHALNLAVVAMAMARGKFSKEL